MKEDNFAQERDEFCKQKESMLKDIQEVLQPFHIKFIIRKNIGLGQCCVISEIFL
jgi:hypothetical protein